jgi:hypothetical protein
MGDESRSIGAIASSIFRTAKLRLLIASHAKEIGNLISVALGPSSGHGHIPLRGRKCRRVYPSGEGILKTA